MNDPRNVPFPRDASMPSAVSKSQGQMLENEAVLPKSTECVLMDIARGMWGQDNKKERCENTENRDFREFFGRGCYVASRIYEMLLFHSLFPEGRHPCHFLWSLILMKIYGKERNLCTLAGGVDTKTFRKWAWLYIDAITDLELVVVSNYSKKLFKKIANLLN